MNDIEKNKNCQATTIKKLPEFLIINLTVQLAMSPHGNKNHHAIFNTIDGTPITSNINSEIAGHWATKRMIF
ncbi:MAG: hypothetical protein WCP18_01810 [bacterium]